MNLQITKNGLRRWGTLLKQTHTCEKSEGKMMLISHDKLGNTFCGYCNKRVDYRKLIKEVNEYAKTKIITN